MPQITSNFIFRSKLPNFERDSFDTLREMRDVPSSWIDEGHISYCKETGTHYKFNSSNSFDDQTGYWSILVPEDLVVLGYVTEEQLNAMLNDYAKGFEVDDTIDEIKQTTQEAIEDNTKNFEEKLEQAQASWESIAHRNYVHKTDLEDYVKTEDADKTYLTQDSADDRYMLKTELPDGEGYMTKDEADKLYAEKDATDGFDAEITANQKAIKELSDELDSIKSSILTKEEAHSTYTTSAYVNEKVRNTENEFQTKIDSINVDIESYKGEVSDTYVPRTEIEETYVPRTEIEEVYATKAYADDKTSVYRPSANIDDNVWVEDSPIESLEGKNSDDQVFKDGISYTEIFDSLIFKEVMPEFVKPSSEITLATDAYDFGGAELKDGNYYILKEVGEDGPTDQSFGFNTDRGMIKWNNHPNSPYAGEAITGNEAGDVAEKPEVHMVVGDEDTAIGSHKIQLGIQEYYYVNYFKDGQVPVSSWNKEYPDLQWKRNTPVESKNRVFIEGTYPTYSLTSTDTYEKDALMRWEDEMSIEFTLKPSCRLDQSFKLPREMKQVMLYNGIAGGYVPESIDHYKRTNDPELNGYTIYTYDASKYAHRGEVKIKVIF